MPLGESMEHGSVGGLRRPEFWRRVTGFLAEPVQRIAKRNSSIISDQMDCWKREINISIMTLTQVPL